jgi:hypothetical protein
MNSRVSISTLQTTPHSWRLLVTWKISLEISGLVEQEEDAMVQLSQAYLEWEQRTEQRGIKRGIERGSDRWFYVS